MESTVSLTYMLQILSSASERPWLFPKQLPDVAPTAPTH